GGQPVSADTSTVPVTCTSVPLTTFTTAVGVPTVESPSRLEAVTATVAAFTAQSSVMVAVYGTENSHEAPTSPPVASTVTTGASFAIEKSSSETSKNTLPTAAIRMRPCEVVTHGNDTDWLPSLATPLASVVGKVVPPSVDSLMSTVAAT